MKKPARLPGVFTRILSFIPLINIFTIIYLGLVSHHPITWIIGFVYLGLLLISPQVSAFILLFGWAHYFFAYRLINRRITEKVLDEEVSKNIIGDNADIIEPTKKYTRKGIADKKEWHQSIIPFKEKEGLHKTLGDREILQESIRTGTNQMTGMDLKDHIGTRTISGIPRTRLDFDRIRALREEIETLKVALSQTEIELSMEESLIIANNGIKDINEVEGMRIPNRNTKVRLKNSHNFDDFKQIEFQSQSLRSEEEKFITNNASSDDLTLSPKKGNLYLQGGKRVNNGLEKGLSISSIKSTQAQRNESDSTTKRYDGDTADEQKLRADALGKATAFDDDPIIIDNLVKSISTQESRLTKSKIDDHWDYTVDSDVDEMKTAQSHTDSEFPLQDQIFPGDLSAKSDNDTVQLPDTFEPRIINGRYRIQPPMQDTAHLLENKGDNSIDVNLSILNRSQALTSKPLENIEEFHQLNGQSSKEQSSLNLSSQWSERNREVTIASTSDSNMHQSVSTSSFGWGRNDRQGKYDRDRKNEHSIKPFQRSKSSLRLDAAMIDSLRVESEAVRDALLVEEYLSPSRSLMNLQDMTRVYRSLSPKALDLMHDLFISQWRVPLGSSGDMLVNEINRQAEYVAARSILVVNRGWIELEREYRDEFEEVISRGNKRPIDGEHNQMAPTSSVMIFDTDSLSGALKHLVQNLSELEQETIRIVLKSDKPYRDLKRIADKNLSMPDALLDSVNEKAADFLDDILIETEDEPKILEEYAELLQNSLFRSIQ